MANKCCGAWDCAKCGQDSLKAAKDRANRAARELAASLIQQNLQGAVGDKWQVLERLMVLEAAALIAAGSVGATAIKLLDEPPRVVKRLKAKAANACILNYELGASFPLDFEAFASPSNTVN